MNWDQVEGKWEDIKGQVKEKWGKITDNDLLVIKGKKDQMLGKLQEHYGYTKEQAQKELDNFASNCSCGTSSEGNTKSL